MKKDTFQIALLVLVLAAFLTNCDQKKAQATYDTFNLNETASLAVGKTSKLSGDDLKIQFVAVTQDSRCPEGVNCIVAGEVKVSLKVNTGGADHDINMTKEGKQKGGVSATVGDFSIEMIEVDPYPKDGVKVEKDSYVLSFKVIK